MPSTDFPRKSPRSRRPTPEGPPLEVQVLVSQPIGDAHRIQVAIANRGPHVCHLLSLDTGAGTVHLKDGDILGQQIRPGRRTTLWFELADILPWGGGELPRSNAQMSLRYVDLGAATETRSATDFNVALLTREEWGPSRPGRKGQDGEE